MKTCRKAYSRAHYLENEGKMRHRQGGEKTCLECKETFKGRGNQKRCPECQRTRYEKSSITRRRKYVANNREKIAAAKKKYRKTKHGRETEAASNKKWKEKNKEQQREYSSEYHREYHRKMSPAKRAKHLENKKKYNRKNRVKVESEHKK